MNMQYTPTVNEIRYTRERGVYAPCCEYMRHARYREGDTVCFRFNGKSVTGRVTRAICDKGEYTYHIETPEHLWYRGIDQSCIIGKAEKPGEYNPGTYNTQTT